MAQPCTLTAHMEAQSTHTRSRPRPNRDVCPHSADDGAYLVSGSQEMMEHCTAPPRLHDPEEVSHGDTWHGIVGMVKNVAVDCCPGLAACDGLRPMVA